MWRRTQSGSDASLQSLAVRGTSPRMALLAISSIAPLFGMAMKRSTRGANDQNSSKVKQRLKFPKTKIHVCHFCAIRLTVTVGVELQLNRYVFSSGFCMPYTSRARK
ncbi:hypothetical protein RRG08_050202 [Elysia crispata]|uniref:Uncharacterized protein n=1 Tax=Elysia crispata TaxID=231223 RepID=A0AAE0Z6N7_9GAST|nr:hypothetical protein RRG08_050202 [Elysia crispata]